jgi:hypothetical protein
MVNGRWKHALAWFTPGRVVAFTVLASIPAKVLSRRLVDPDLWWHLQTGELIVRDRAVPATDPFSFTAAGEPWVVQEWGSEVILHAIREAFGLWGIFAYRAIGLTILYLLVARLLVKRMGSGIGTWALLALVAYAGFSNWTERPNLLSFILFVVTLDLVERRDRAIWFFVPLALLWTNLHGMVLLGVGLVGLLAIVEWLKVVTRWPGAEVIWARRLGLVALTGSLCMLANPSGTKLVSHILALPGRVQEIAREWSSPNFHEPVAMLFLLLLLVTIAALALDPFRGDPVDVALVLTFTGLALFARRNFVVATIVLGLVASRALPGALSVLSRPPRARREVPGSIVLGVIAFLAATVALGAIVADALPKSAAPRDILDDTFPVEAIDALDRPGVRLFAFDYWTGMVIDRAWPNARVFIDLRWDFYGEKESLNYVSIINARPGWDRSLEDACVTHVLIRAKDPLSRVLGLSTNWQVERRDDRSVTYRRASPSGCEEFPIPPVA